MPEQDPFKTDIDPRATEDPDFAYFKFLLESVKGGSQERLDGIRGLREAAEGIASAIDAPNASTYVLGYFFETPLTERRLVGKRSAILGRPVEAIDLIAQSFNIKLSPAPSVLARLSEEPDLKLLK